MITFTIPGDPVPKARARAGNGHHFTPERTRRYEKLIGALAQAAGLSPTTAPVRVEMRFWRATRRRCDLDNLVKSVLDGLNRIAFADDSQIVEIVARKGVDAAHPRAIVTVEEVL